MTAYKFVTGLMVIILLAFMTIPLSSVLGTITTEFNGMTTNSDVISYNNIYSQILIIGVAIIMIIIMVSTLKPPSQEENMYYE